MLGTTCCGQAPNRDRLVFDEICHLGRNPWTRGRERVERDATLCDRGDVASELYSAAMAGYATRGLGTLHEHWQPALRPAVKVGLNHQHQSYRRLRMESLVNVYLSADSLIEPVRGELPGQRLVYSTRAVRQQFTFSTA